MLTIICGEDVVNARTYYSALREEYKNKGYEIRDITFPEIPEITKWLSESPSLFSQQKIFFTSGLNKKISKRTSPEMFALVEKLAKNKDFNIIDWEEFSSGRELKITNGITIKEFKPSQSIFKLLDACYPGNLKTFVSILHGLPSKTDEIFIFIMLVRHIRNLLCIKLGQPSKTLQRWQIAKLQSQAKWWKTERLIGFYDGLSRIDMVVKTSKNPFTVKESLDTLTCYFL